MNMNTDINIQFNYNKKIYLVIIIIFIGCLIWITNHIINDVILEKKGTTSIAIVQKKEKKSKSYFIWYDFYSDKGEMYTGRSVVRRNVYHKTKPNDQIYILYNPANPDKNKMLEQSMINAPFGLLVLIGYVAIISFVFIYLITSKILLIKILHMSGKNTMGLITNIEYSKKVKGMKTYHVYVSFHDDEGNSYSVIIKDHLLLKNEQVGQSVSVIYNSKNPKRFIVRDLDY